MRLLAELFLVVMLFFGVSLSSQAIDISDAEFKRMPKYCYAKIRDKSESAKKRWGRVLGNEGWLHVHHFCFAMKYEMLAERARVARKPKERKFNLQRAEANYNYCFKHWDPSERLWPEVASRKARVVDRLGRKAEAAQLYNQAINANPKFIGAYAALADLYRSMGNPENADEILRKGLKVAPNSALLRQRLGG